LPLVYDELRRLAAQKLAQEKPGQTLQATALVHEVYVRLVGGGEAGQEQPWGSRGHSFAAEAMRRILVEQARRKGRGRHGGGLQRADLLDEEVPAPADDEQLLLLDEALTRLAAARPQAAVRVRKFNALLATKAGCRSSSFLQTVAKPSPAARTGRYASGIC
jgi:RNA polymerase sigma factor (TIGR02999 family)